MKAHRLAMLVGVLALAFSTCGPTLGMTAVDGADDADLVAAERPDMSTGRTRVADSAVQDSPEVTFDPVSVQQPKLRLHDLPLGRDVVAEVMAVEGVSFATSVLLGELPVGQGEGAKPIRVAAVDPAGFRIFTPQVTADAVEVWQRLVEGDAALTHDAGHRLSLPLGTRVTTGGRSTLRVGAYASNGVPPVADAIVSKDTARQLGWNGQPALLVSLSESADPSAMARRLQELLGVKPDVIQDPVTRRAFLTGAAARSAFEPFSYISIGDGMIQMDPAWVRRNIVYASVPIFRGQVLCHRLLVTQLRGALQEVQDAGLANLIDPTQYGGCWVPRHIDFNPHRALSMHAWGLAVDFNVSTNQLGHVPQMDPRIVEIFERWGFVWGGHWSRPDGMHFELGALMESPGG